MHRKKILKWAGLSALLVSLILIGASAVAYWQGYLGILIKSPQQKITLQTVICDESTIESYNNVFVFTPPEQSNQTPVDNTRSKLIEFAKTVEEKKDFMADPSCVYMAFSGAISEGNDDKAKKYVDRLKVLAGEGQYVSTSVTGITSISQMEGRVYQTDAAPTDGGGSG